MKTITINLYSLDELSQYAREKAIIEANNFLNNELIDFEDENGIMQYEYLEHTEEQAEEFIKINEYLFFKNGEIANTVQYTGEHKRSGEMDFIFKGETIKI